MKSNAQQFEQRGDGVSIRARVATRLAGAAASRRSIRCCQLPAMPRTRPHSSRAVDSVTNSRYLFAFKPSAGYNNRVKRPALGAK